MHLNGDRSRPRIKIIWWVSSEMEKEEGWTVVGGFAGAVGRMVGWRKNETAFTDFVKPVFNIDRSFTGIGISRSIGIQQSGHCCTEKNLK
jgi:hypothetical protein